MTASVLATAVRRLSPDLVLCGEGSADVYFQQTGLQMGERLSWATLNCVDAVEPVGDCLRVQRALENEIEILEVPLPAVLSVTASINTPPLPPMRAILAAGKKQVTVWSLGDLGLNAVPASVETISTTKPSSRDRKQIVLSGTTEEAVAGLIRCLKQEALV